jgi:riboflavin biosynthesis pyrimidine reductase
LSLERIWPDRAAVTADDLVGEAAAPEGRPWVSGIMVSSLDGRATLEGTSRTLGGPQDLQLLLALRRRADALIVGPGTVAAEGYGPLPCPAVLVSRSFELPWEAGLFAAPGQRVLVYTHAGAEAPPGLPADVEVVEELELTAVLADLRARGIERLLCEGGPTVNRALLDAGLLDELFLTLSPVVSGAGPPIVADGPSAPLSLRSVATADGDLYLRYSV